MLFLVATPIGEKNEISLRALEILRSASHIICESTRETSTLLKFHDILGKNYSLLNEHTTDEEVQDLLEICEKGDVALVSDCGTPGFCDPGPKLITLCRQRKIPIRSILGASSLMGLLSLSSQRLDSFVFVGFLPSETEERQRTLKNLQNENRALIFMDTPYRQMKLLRELATVFPKREGLLVQNLSQGDEMQIEGLLPKILDSVKNEKSEFLFLVYPSLSGSKSLPKSFAPSTPKTPIKKLFRPQTKTHPNRSSRK